MGLICATYNDEEAKKLEIVLLKGIETNNKEVIDFLKKNIYPLYNEHIGETFGSYEIDSKTNEHLEKYYGEHN